MRSSARSASASWARRCPTSTSMASSASRSATSRTFRPTARGLDASATGDRCCANAPSVDAQRRHDALRAQSAEPCSRLGRRMRFGYRGPLDRTVGVARRHMCQIPQRGQNAT
eukprot:6638192-Prymnesium_polylepis.1